jgi:hypothetical protein
MQVEYRFLGREDLESLRAFCTAMGYSEKLTRWTLDSVAESHPMFKASGEFIDGRLTGLLAAASLGCFFKASEFVPSWAGVRVDRLPGAQTPFTTFMHLASSLVTDFFEPLGYYHHYMIRRLPKRYRDNLQLIQMTKRAWAQGPYDVYIERIIKSEQDLDLSPTLFKQMIGYYAHPLIVLSMNMSNEKREKRVHAHRTSISL